MKTLLLLRHAKSSWKDPDLPDLERPLSKRGMRACQQIGEVILIKELQPQLIISSTAVRTRQTAECVAEICRCQDKLSLDEELYLSEAEVYVQRLHLISDELERVMVVGHNPGLESLLQMLSGQIETFPTAALAHISLPIFSWKDLTTETEGILVDLWKPKELPEDFVEREHEKKQKKKKDAAETSHAEEKAEKKDKKEKHS